MAVVTDDLLVSLHTAQGDGVYQFTPDDYSGLNWTRDHRDTSRCDLTVPPLLPGGSRLPDIVYWHHWLTVWDGDRLGSAEGVLWTGPIKKIRDNRAGLTLQAVDHSAYLARTRNPMTKRWDAADPATVAGELWSAMVLAQGLRTRPVVLADPEGDRYDFQVVTDEKTLDQTLGDLVSYGLRWSVVAGTPVLGPLSLEPVATLGEEHFLGDGIDFVRDGSAVVNNVLVRGPVNLARAAVDFYGQNLQAIVNVDNMSGVSNVTRAAQQYVQSAGRVRTTLELPGSTVLSPTAPVSIDQLMPSARFIIEARGTRQLMALTGCEVDRRAGAATVKVSMETVEEKIELTSQKTGQALTLGAGAAGR
ncbi:minor tail protein [Mycobacterium phage Vincenzo]|uniref:Minor tail protein n=2 Tax=Coopervirus vincenzo TaxID=1983110 RepID=A0A0F6WDV9_9CAUD|nr:minor tail protein [Mycobacterium phage Vincenzo]AKF14290.1 minor tail protein [Mycobacterium phage Vincenzo]AKF14693.1 minor tail protein [Mycobacterium phage AlanGrant]